MHNLLRPYNLLSSKTKESLTDVLQKYNLLTNKKEIIQPSGNIKELHAWHFQHIPNVNYVGRILLNDLTAALGRFSIYVIPFGFVEPIKDGHQITIDKVGIYIKDSFDFNGEQPLGYWDPNNNTIGLTALSGKAIGNQSFVDWRAVYNEGKDFEVFSNLKIIEFNDKFTTNKNF